MRISLVDLEPEWMALGDMPGSRRRGGELDITTAQGVWFIDPVEYTRCGGKIGASHVLCWFKNRGVPDDELPGPGRWDVSGSGFHDLTLSPSVDLTANNTRPDRWHGWVQNGTVT